MLTVPIKLARAYEDADLKIEETSASARVRLIASGEYKAVAEAVIGVDKRSGDNIAAAFEFPYEYDLMNNRVTFCDCLNTDDDAVPPRVRLYSVSAPEAPHFLHAFAAEAGDPVHANLTGHMQSALEDIVSACCKRGYTVRKHVKFPVSLRDKKAVYVNGVLSHVLDPETEDERGLTTLPLTSTIDTEHTEAFDYGDAFCNVLGSSKDEWPSGYSSWIDVWKKICDPDDIHKKPFCCSKGAGNTSKEGSKCNAPIYGGHILRGHLDDKARRITRLTENPGIYILPICNAHNDGSGSYNPEMRNTYTIEDIYGKNVGVTVYGVIILKYFADPNK